MQPILRPTEVAWCFLNLSVHADYPGIWLAAFHGVCLGACESADAAVSWITLEQ
jgi:hypothetical protein